MEALLLGCDGYFENLGQLAKCFLPAPLSDHKIPAGQSLGSSSAPVPDRDAGRGNRQDLASELENLVVSLTLTLSRTSTEKGMEQIASIL